MNIIDRHTIMIRVYQLVYLTLCLTFLTNVVNAQDNFGISPNNLYVEVSDNSVLLNVKDITIKELLEEIALQSNLELVLHKTLNERITIQLDRPSLVEVLKTILYDQSYALQYDQPLSSVENINELRPNTLWVFAEWKGGVDEYKRIPSPDIVTRNKDQMQALREEIKHEQIYFETFATKGVEISRLSIALHDEDADVRFETIDALGDIGDKKAIPDLEQALMDPDKDVRIAAIDAFADIGGDESAQALAIALRDDDDALREEAVEALGDIGGETAIRLLRQALLDQDQTIRETAAEFLADLESI